MVSTERNQGVVFQLYLQHRIQYFIRNSSNEIILGPILKDKSDPEHFFHKSIIINNMIIRSDREADGFCIENGKVIKITTIKKKVSTGNISLSGFYFKNIRPFYCHPCDSDNVGVIVAENLKSTLFEFPASNSIIKCYAMPLQKNPKSYVIAKLLHEIVQ